MLNGRYGETSGRPYVEGRLAIPRLGIRTNISFCIDTGADRTILMPVDSMRLKIDFGLLGNRVEGVGLGGAAYIFEESAILAFVDAPRAVHVYQFGLKIAADNPKIRGLPSLLGRDILNRWRMNYHPANNVLELDLLSADATLPLRTSR